MNMGDRASFWRERLEALEQQGRLRRLRTAEPLPAHETRIEERRLLNLASNDYLGFGSDAELQRAFLETSAESGVAADVGLAASASRLLSGNHPAYAALEQLLDVLYGHGRRSLALGSGYHANLGILPALAGRGDLIFSDRANHASLVDGIRLSRAAWVRYRHGDVEHLGELLAARRRDARQAFIVTESIFSMDGDCADLRALAGLKRRYDACLVVDEAHAVGVRGARGLGLGEETGTLEDVDVLVGTFGKALASSGAFVVTSAEVREVLVNTMRTLIFTTALPPLVVNWSRHVLTRSVEAGERRAALAGLTEMFRRELARRNLPAAGSTQIVPLLVGTDADAVALSERLERRGYLAPPIRPPTVPKGTARLRFSLGAGMDAEALRALAECVAAEWAALS